MANQIVGSKACSIVDIVGALEYSKSFIDRVNSWTLLAKCLLVDDAIIHAHRRKLIDQMESLEDVIQEIFVTWVGETGNGASLGNLISALKTESEFASTVEKLQEKFNVSIDTTELAKFKEIINEPGKYNTRKLIDYIAENLLDLVKFTTLDDQLVETLLKLEVINREILEDIESAPHRKAKAVKFYNYILDQCETVKQIFDLIVQLQYKGQHNAVRILVKPFLQHPSPLQIGKQEKRGSSIHHYWLRDSVSASSPKKIRIDPTVSVSTIHGTVLRPVAQNNSRPLVPIKDY